MSQTARGSMRRSSYERRAGRSSTERNSTGSLTSRNPTKRAVRRSKESSFQVNNHWVPPRKPSTAELGAARRAFYQLDKDNTGSIDMDELRTMMRSLGQDPTDAELKELINSVDENRDGQIQMREFIQLYTKGIDSKPTVGALDINDAFASFGGNPRDKTSRVDPDSVHDKLLDMFELDLNCQEMFGTTGEISKQDFEVLLTTKPTSRHSSRRGGVTLPPLNPTGAAVAQLA